MRRADFKGVACPSDAIVYCPIQAENGPLFFGFVVFDAKLPSTFCTARFANLGAV